LKQREAAERLGISTRRLQMLAERGAPKRGEGRTVEYPWPTLRVWYDHYREETLTKKHRPSNVTDARARKLEAEARLKELEAATAEGRLVEIEAFDLALGEALQRVDRKLKALPTRVGPQVASPRDAPELVAKLREAVEEVRAELRAAQDVPNGHGAEDVA
jgi:phage terminase Nu1 subunit (DNA packaging protein)